MSRRAELIRSAWDDAGRPLLATGSKKRTVPHPLLEMMNAAEAHAAPAGS